MSPNRGPKFTNAKEELIGGLKFNQRCTQVLMEGLIYQLVFTNMVGDILVDSVTGSQEHSCGPYGGGP